MDCDEVSTRFERHLTALEDADGPTLRASQDREFEESARSDRCEGAIALYLVHVGDTRWCMRPVASTFWRTTLQQYPETLGSFLPIVHRDWDASRAMVRARGRQDCFARMSLLDPWAFLATYSTIKAELAVIIPRVGKHAANRLRTFSRVMDFVRVRDSDLDDPTSLRLAFEDFTTFAEVPGIGQDDLWVAASLVVEAGIL